MKKIAILIFVLCFTSIQSQEKKIKFDKGTLRICSAKNFNITGYNGSEVIIKSLHEKRTNKFAYVTAVGELRKGKGTTAKSATIIPKKDVKGYYQYAFEDASKKEGLKKLGKKNENRELGIYFKIEQKGDELVFSDDIPSSTGQLVMFGNESYEIRIPNSLKLIWETNGCTIMNTASQRPIFYNSKPSLLTDFEGEVDIKSNLSNTKLVDVSGPVSINTIGGNVTVEFDKKKPTNLYSIYSNNGFIDITIPDNSSLSLDVKGQSIYSDLDFSILDEKEINDFGHVSSLMKLKQGSGKVKMKLDAGYGNIYLRKKK